MLIEQTDDIWSHFSIDQVSSNLQK